ncbi:MAG: ProQ/FINO family protein [Pontibacterium sp.]
MTDPNSTTTAHAAQGEITSSTPEVDALCASTEQLLKSLDDGLNAAEARQAQLQAEKQAAATQQTKIHKTNQTEAYTVSEAVTSGKKPKSKSHAANLAAMQLLSETYPDTFNRKNVRPLKIGIQEDLVADEKVAKNKIKRALAGYVRSINYLKSIQVDADRIDLNGEPAGKVTASEAEHAKSQLKEIFKRRKEARETQEREERMSAKLEALVGMNKR